MYSFSHSYPPLPLFELWMKCILGYLDAPRTHKLPPIHAWWNVWRSIRLTLKKGKCYWPFWEKKIEFCFEKKVLRKSWVIYTRHLVECIGNMAVFLETTTVITTFWLFSQIINNILFFLMQPWYLVVRMGRATTHPGNLSILEPIHTLNWNKYLCCGWWRFTSPYEHTNT